ncbi:Aste57867_480 [Aphanomyces stellatus]|uniref:Aste57867_480 protein n=1 Tax=Aphanomyces stellatus TaxID=120398 RepID=A0A485K338_9STRA|nr:hypothetical protein As57867_000479 [Aphanomyces stellatus]VFT77705.1 Aste57867_480 [Aphanomyces stellatus]
MGGWRATGIFVLFCVVNFLNFLDRGIIPGAPTQFQYFIQVTRNVSSSEEGFYLGFLSSSFVASYAIFVVLFGFLSIHVKPFRLVSIGLVVWCLAVLLCGLAKEAMNFQLLLVGRLLSGIGESSFQCIAPAFIDDHAPAGTRSFWLGVFYACSSVGMAFGVQYGAVMANSKLGWHWAFYLEAIVVFPLALICMLAIPAEYNVTPAEAAARHDPEKRAVVGDASHTAAVDDDNHSFFHELGRVCHDPIFGLIIWGTGASIFTLAGLSAFGTLFVVGLGLFQTDTEASVVLGCVVVASGMLGTPLGGLALDHEAAAHAPTRRQHVALGHLVVTTTLSVVLALASWVALPDKVWFLCCYALAMVFYAGSTSATITALLLCVHPSRRALATGVYSLFTHVLGDVPAPVIIGALKDKWAPHCDSVNMEGHIVLNPLCRQLDFHGLLMTMLCPLVWMTWSAVSYGVAYWISCRRVREPTTNPIAASTGPPVAHV